MEVLDNSADSISASDLVIGILTRERDSQWVLFELGQAHILGKRLLIIAYPSAGEIPSQFRKLLIVRSNLTDLGPIEFALEQVLAAPKNLAKKTKGQSAPSRQVDRQALLQLKEMAIGGFEGHRLLEDLVAKVLRAGGADAVIESESPDYGADLAVWSDQWSPTIANPLLVEIKMTVRGRAQAEKVVAQLSSHVERVGASVGLLIVAQGSGEILRLPKSKMKKVVVLSVADLIEGIEGKGLYDTVLGALAEKRVG
jgi:hypothetical protein